jgi:mannosyl-oligosaccharide alpha-1,2-mannosidase
VCPFEARYSIYPYPYLPDVKSANAIIDNLLYITPKRHLLFVTDTNGGKPSYTFEHLSCFLPGLLALGVHSIPDLSPREKELHSWAAEGLAYTCWMSYADQATGLGPDEMKMDRWADDEQGKWMTHIEQWEKEGRLNRVPPGLREVAPAKKEDREYVHQKSPYLLRPEVCLWSFFSSVMIDVCL